MCADMMLKRLRFAVSDLRPASRNDAGLSMSVQPCKYPIGLYLSFHKFLMYFLGLIVIQTELSKPLSPYVRYNTWLRGLKEIMTDLASMVKNRQVWCLMAVSDYYIVYFDIYYDLSFQSFFEVPITIVETFFNYYHY